MEKMSTTAMVTAIALGSVAAAYAIGNMKPGAKQQ